MQKETMVKDPLKPTTFLEFLPVSLFGADMGLCALCFCWRLAFKQWHFIGVWPGEIVGAIAVLAFILLIITYTVKLVKYPELVKAEFYNDVSVCFFATVIISILLIPGVLLPYIRSLAIGMWLVGSLLMLVFAWYVLRRWLDNKQQMENALPVWILPVVGTLDVPIVGNNLGLEIVHEYCLMFFGVGILFALILIGIIISRLMFKPSLPVAIQPTLLILTGPMALAYNSYVGLMHGSQDIFSSSLFYFNLFLLALLGSKVLLVFKSCPFKVSWWSVSFPLTAITITAFRYASYHNDHVHLAMAALLLLVTTSVIIFLFFQTWFRIIKGTFAQ